MQFEQRVSLVIAAHRSGPMLDACLASAQRLDPAPREVIVAVDGALPDVVAAVERSGFRLVSLPSAPGVSAARNRGAQAASGDILIFVDSDVEMPTDFLAGAASAFARHPEAAAVIGSYDDAPEAPGLVSRYRNLLHHYTHQLGKRQANTFWAACGAIRRDVFKSVGGFDESYVEPSVEDIDLGYRLRQAGHSIRLDPEWQVKHLKTWRLRDLFLTDFMRRALPWSMLLRREGRIDNDLNIGWMSRVSAGFVLIAACALLAGLLHPIGLLVAVAALAAATALNWHFYRFLASRAGLAFAALSMPLHWIYFLVGASGFAAGMVVSGRRQNSNRMLVR
jgi:GT2 family glycosyltransferase